MTPRLSVVVPFYNVGDYIGDCLDSIARQTCTDFEAILVDDGSQDDSAAIAKDFCAADPRFRIVAQENQGLGPARNTGVRHAQGEFITFVDSDDLVTRHAYERMVRTLDETGSSFVGGNARRFNNSSGVRASWIQRLPFAKNRTATHITEFPELVLDRTVWNKVYRRSFWDEFDYRFPAIRYEDYPVTLKAHLDALTVDCISAPVYYWRERESGESITQQKFQYTNLLDRVRSAEMVMDLVAEGVPDLRRRVQAHFAEIDLLALVQAFGSVPENEQETLVALGRRMIDRFDEDVLAETHPYNQLQHSALRSGDIDLLRRLATFRQDGGLRGGARVARRPLHPWQFEHLYPGLDDRSSSVPRKLYRVPTSAFTLATTVQKVVWKGDQLSVSGTAEIRHLDTRPGSDLKIALVADGEEIPLRPRRFETLDKHGDPSLVGFEVLLGPEVLAKVPASGVPAHFKVSLRSGRLHREGRLHGPLGGSPGWPPGAWSGTAGWVQPGAGPVASFVIRRMADPWRLTAMTARADSFVLEGRLPPGVERPQLVFERALSGGDLTLDVRTTEDADGLAFVAEVPLAPIVDDANPDDPFTQRTSRAVKLVAGSQTRLLFWTAPEQALSHVFAGRLLTLTRSVGNYVNLHESPIRLSAERAEVVDDSQLLVSGALLDDEATFTWRRFLEDSDDHIDVPCRLRRTDDSWVAAVDVDDLIPSEPDRRTADPLTSLADWSLFAVGADGSSYSVQCDPFLASRLPVQVRTDDRTAALRPRAGTLHLEVR